MTAACQPKSRRSSISHRCLFGFVRILAGQPEKMLSRASGLLYRSAQSGWRGCLRFTFTLRGRSVTAGYNGLVAVLDFEPARECVIARVSASNPRPHRTEVDLLEAAGRVLAEDVLSDRDYPPTARSVRDGFAVRSADLPGDLAITGEVRAGQSSSAAVGSGQAIEIMTGAPLPAGADAVVMVEHTLVMADASRSIAPYRPAKT